VDTKHFVVSLTFPHGPPKPEERSQQKEFLSGLKDAGVLLLAGQFVDESGGGMSILRADSLEAAKERFAESPLVRAGRVGWDVREWNITWGLESLVE
jgi:uncharacterized protein YciI